MYLYIYVYIHIYIYIYIYMKPYLSSSQGRAGAKPCKVRRPLGPAAKPGGRVGADAERIAQHLGLRTVLTKPPQ